MRRDFHILFEPAHQSLFVPIRSPASTLLVCLYDILARLHADIVYMPRASQIRANSGDLECSRPAHWRVNRLA